ncbi:hypothetical protein REC12_22185 [Desulfosporosinus sp. PR]|uniref:hypothetical protein n=1 Tax=Candidatus Desulfosporosinus nitrosoreducens TaxID=3401928 RepID=UPI0027F89932|nr:hypothetical protein [Desulfosporosinus sp. PR]MDQ7096307.1 hypothetical protein [Desulfosporosinus sp. PR]
MLDIKEMQQKIDRLDYWDTKVLELTCEYFADEVVLIFDRDIPKKLTFTTCYTVTFDHYWENYRRDKPIKEWTRPQMPFFLQAINVEVGIKHNMELYAFSIDLPPMSAYIMCKDVKIENVEL